MALKKAKSFTSVETLRSRGKIIEKNLIAIKEKSLEMQLGQALDSLARARKASERARQQDLEAFGRARQQGRQQDREAFERAMQQDREAFEREREALLREIGTLKEYDARIEDLQKQVNKLLKE